MFRWVPALALLLAVTAATTCFARVGAPVALLRERFGKAPDPQSPKGMAIWFIEVEDGPLVYTATLNAKGISIAEGIKPLKRAVLTADIARDFIEDQTAPIKDSKTARVVPPGEKYVFAGQSFTCEANEWVLVDEPNGRLIIWTRGPIATVMAVSREMMERTGG